MVNLVANVNPSPIAISVGANGGTPPPPSSRGRKWLESISLAMHDIYSIDGFEKWTKALIAHLRFLSLIPCIRGIFRDCIETLESQKDLYYASQVFPSVAQYLKKDTDGSYKFNVKTTTYEEKSKFLYAIGSFFEVGKFLQRYNVVSFSAFTSFSNKYGAIKVFNRRLDDINVFGALFDRPKDFCVFIASICDLLHIRDKKSQNGTFQWNKLLWNDQGQIDWETILKATTSTGKMVLIFFGKHNYKKPWFAIADLITQNASLASLLMKRMNDREKRFNDPYGTAAA